METSLLFQRETKVMTLLSNKFMLQNLMLLFSAVMWCYLTDLTPQFYVLELVNFVLENSTFDDKS